MPFCIIRSPSIFTLPISNASSSNTHRSGLRIVIGDFPFDLRPGTVAGLTLALERFGTMPLVDVMQPAIDLAEEGIPVTQGFADSMTPGRVKRLSRWPASRDKFFKSDGTAYQIGEKWRQPMLARSLKLIAERTSAL